VLLAAGCGSQRSTFVHYPGAPAAVDRSASDAKALQIADQVLAAAGGAAAWSHAKQLRWEQAVSADGQVTASGEQAWDRWNARHWGLLHREGNDVVVGYELYGDSKMGYAHEGKHSEKLDPQTLAKALDLARARFAVDTAVLAMQFLMLEPGAKLKYVGAASDDTGTDAADELAVTFADPMYKGYEFHPIVDRATSTIARVEIAKDGAAGRVGYALQGRVTVGGLKFATARKDLGSSDTVAIKNLRVTEPEDSLFVMPIQ
jgi:hypothetical protein